MQLRPSALAPRSRASSRRWLVALALALAGCAQVDVIAVAIGMRDAAPPDAAPMDAAALDAAALDAAPGDAAATVPDAAPPDAAPGEMACSYRLLPAGSGSAESVAAVAERGLARAICACTGYSGSAALLADAVAGAGADVAVNAGFDQQLSATISGSLTAAGVDGISIGAAAQLVVSGDLASGGPLEGAEGSVDIAGDAEVDGRIDVLELRVGGTLVQSPGEPLLVGSSPTLGATRSEAVEVPAPCACDAAALVDVGGLVRDAEARAQALPSGALPAAARCTEYFLEGGSVDTLELDVTESTALYVRADLHVAALRITTAPGAELDLFLEGNLRVTGPLALGGDGAPVRVYVGGTGTIDLAEGGELHGALYAPHAELVLSGPLEVAGALFVRRVAASGTVTVHHDAAVTAAP